MALARQVLAAQLHRRRAEAVAGEHTGRDAALGQTHDQQVAPVRLANPGHRDAEFNTGHRIQFGGVGGEEIDGHRALQWQAVEVGLDRRERGF
jgi:hypothetical protein